MDREKLIELCERAIVQEFKWDNRDSASAHMQLGQAWALLKSGCDYKITSTEDDTIWLYIYYRGFNYFEFGDKEAETFYLPSEGKLLTSNGDDWY